MKVTNSSSKTRKASNKGTVQVAVWRENSEFERYHDVFTNYSKDIFFDFARPLKLLDGPGWSSSIKTSSDGDFFVFSSDLGPLD